MNLLNHLQTNSNFYFCKQFSNLQFDDYLSISIQAENLKQSQLDNILESISFSSEFKDSYVLIKTNHGEILLTSVTNQKPHLSVQDFLNTNSKENPCFYFSNVDYFSFGTFGLSENGKIIRYLSVNIEADENENVVTWVGKPHKWEQSTHTFYTKKKLEDLEMDFDSDTICDIITYYLPFVESNVQIKELKIFSSHQAVIDEVKDQLSNSPSILPKTAIAAIVASMKNNNIPVSSIKIFKYKDKIWFSNNIVFANPLSDNIKNTIIFYSPKTKSIPIKDFTLDLFKSVLKEFFRDLPNAEKTSLGKIANKVLRGDETTNFHEACLMFELKPQTNTINLAFDTGKIHRNSKNKVYSFFRKFINMGSNFSEKCIESLYKKIIKLKI